MEHTGFRDLQFSLVCKKITMKLFLSCIRTEDASFPSEPAPIARSVFRAV